MNIREGSTFPNYIIFQAISALVTVAVARPEAGYSYNAPSGPSAGGGYPSGPSTSYGAPAPSLVQKHVYVHVPPPETDIPPPRKPLTAAPAQKHYKIIFIKVNNFRNFSDRF